MYIDYILDKYDTDVKHYRLKTLKDFSKLELVSCIMLFVIALCIIGLMVYTLITRDTLTFYVASLFLMLASFVIALVSNRELKKNSHKYISAYEEILYDVEEVLYRPMFSINTKEKFEYMIKTINMQLALPTAMDKLKKTVFRPFMYLIVPVIAFGIGILPDILSPMELFIVTGVVLVAAFIVFIPYIAFYPLIERRVNRKHVLLQRILEDITDIYFMRYIE